MEFVQAIHRSRGEDSNTEEETERGQHTPIKGSGTAQSMRSKRLSTRNAAAGVGVGGGRSGGVSLLSATATTCHPISELDESIAIDAKELRGLMDDSAVGLDAAQEGEEEDDEGDEERDQYVADLCSRFEGAAMTTAKRKFSDAVAEEGEANGSVGDGASTRSSSSSGASACSAAPGLHEGISLWRCVFIIELCLMLVALLHGVPGDHF